MLSIRLLLERFEQNHADSYILAALKSVNGTNVNTIELIYFLFYDCVFSLQLFN